MKKLSGLSIFGIVVLVLVLGTGVWGVSCYNNMIGLKETVDSQFSNIDVQLQRRADLIPNLVNTVKGYASHETQILSDISESRSKLAGASTVADKAAADSELSNSLSRLLVIAENYPNLKADSQFQSLMDNLEGTENRVAVARKDYNASVQNYNQCIKRFPNVIISSMLGFNSAERFEASEGASEVPTVNFS